MLDGGELSGIPGRETVVRNRPRRGVHVQGPSPRQYRNLLTSWVGLALLLGLAFPTTVGGSNWGVTDHTHECDGTVFSQCNARSGIAYVFFAVVTDPDGFIKPATRWEMTNEFTPIPDIVAFETTDLFAATVRIYTSDNNNGYWSWTTCAGGAAKGNQGTRYAWCDPQVLYFNNGVNYGFPTKFNSESQARAIACHELGHTYGLRHATSASDGGSNWSASCMKKSQSVNIHLTNGHDEPALTALYPLP
jgi:hypothetical protein